MMWGTICAALFAIAVPPEGARTSDPYAAIIDRAVDRALAGAPRPVADRATFLRRATIDVTGTLPSAEEVERFLASTDPGATTALVDGLVDSPRAATAFGARWTKTLLGPVEPLRERRLNRVFFARWLAEGWASDRPWDETVTALLTASGGPDTEAATSFFLAQESPEGLVGNVGRLFLASGLRCAECHDHPFQSIRRRDFHELLAFFAKTRVRVERIDDLSEEMRANLSPLAVRRAERALARDRAEGEGFIRRPKVVDVRIGEVKMPGTGEVLTARFRGHEVRRGSGHVLRVALASRLTAKDELDFARAFVNRTWAGLMGRGLVEPIDDLGAAERGTPGAALLDELARTFAERGFQVKALVRGMLRSSAYAVAADANVPRPAALEALAVRVPKPLGAEELLDAITRATGADAMLEERPVIRERMREQALLGLGLAYGDEGELSAPDLGGAIASVPLTLARMNGPLVAKTLVPGKGSTLLQVRGAHPEPAVRLRQLFLATLSRPPTPREVSTLRAEIDLANQTGGRAVSTVWEDVFWALLSSTEFTLNR